MAKLSEEKYRCQWLRTAHAERNIPVLLQTCKTLSNISEQKFQYYDIVSADGLSSDFIEQNRGFFNVLRKEKLVGRARFGRFRQSKKRRPGD